MRSFCLGAVAAAVLTASGATAQTVQSDGCMRLLGSKFCPGFQYAYLNPSNLSNAFPWLEGVNDVTSFDAAGFGYFSNPDQWMATKFGSGELGCTAATANRAVIQWQQTSICSRLVNEQWSSACTARYNASSVASSMKMICQSTCKEYAASETQLVTNTTLCPTNDNPDTRQLWVLKDYTDCTDWFTLASNNTDTCVLGEDNEGNCGFASDTDSLCGYCSASTPADCCYSSNTALGTCGYTLAARPSSSSSATPSSTSGSPSASASAGDSNAATHRGLHGGKLAGTIVGSILGGLLLLALLALLAICLMRRRRNPRHSDTSFAAAPYSSSKRNTNSSTPGHGHNQSEKNLLGASSLAAASSPTMGGGTVYSQQGKGLGLGSGSMESTPMTAYGSSVGPLGAGAGGAAAAGAGGLALGGALAGAHPGERTSGVVLPRVRDENQAGDHFIETGQIVNVLWPYQASLPDELSLTPGQQLRIVRLYDDAWGTAEIVSGGEPSEVGRRGACPLVCLSTASSFGSGTGSMSGSGSASASGEGPSSTGHSP